MRALWGCLSIDPDNALCISHCLQLSYRQMEDQIENVTQMAVFHMEQLMKAMTSSDTDDPQVMKSKGSDIETNVVDKSTTSIDDDRVILPFAERIFDSFYVSILSEKYKNNKTGYLTAFLIGFISNMVGFFSSKGYSSNIYIFKKDTL